MLVLKLMKIILFAKMDLQKTILTRRKSYFEDEPAKNMNKLKNAVKL